MMTRECYNGALSCIWLKNGLCHYNLKHSNDQCRVRLRKR